MKNTARINRSLMAALAVVLMTSIMLLSCGDDERTTTPTSPSDPVFRQLGALSTVTTWEKIWGVSASDMFLMGEEAYVYRGDGTNWAKQPSTVETENTLYSAWGATADDAFFVGRIANAAGDTIKPLLTHYVGGVFPDEILDFEGGLYDIWGAAADTIYAVGFDGTILNYDGTDWNTIATGGTNPAWLNAVWGTSGTSVYASGTNGALLHYDGTSWSAIASHSVEDLWDVWGFSDNSFYCVGSNGTVLHYDGTSMTKMTTPTTRALYSVWGYDENDVYAVGWSGTVLHYDGTAWTEIDSHTTFGFLSVWGTAGGPLYAVGQTVQSYDGSAWTPIKVRNEPDFADIWAGAGTNTSEVVAVGSGGNILYATTGFSFSAMELDSTLMTYDLNGVGGYDGVARFVVGDGGLVLERSGPIEWTEMTSGISADLAAVAVLSDSLAMAVGTGGTLAKYDGSSWSEPDPSLLTEDMYDVWLGYTSEDEILGYAVGQDGSIAGYNGLIWSLMTSGSNANLRSVVGDADEGAYAVGDNGTVLYFDPDLSNWTAINSGTAENLTSIWATFGGGMFIAAESGRVFSFDGTSLTGIETNVTYDLKGVAGFNRLDVYVVGDNNQILRYSP